MLKSLQSDSHIFIHKNVYSSLKFCVNSEIVILSQFNYNDSKLVSGTQNGIFIEIFRAFVVAFSFQEAAVKEDEEEVSDKGSDSEEEETNRDSQSEKDDGSDRDSDREQDEKQSKDDEAVRLISLNNWNYTSDDSFGFYRCFSFACLLFLLVLSNTSIFYNLILLLQNVFEGWQL